MQPGFARAAFILEGPAFVGPAPAETATRIANPASQGKTEQESASVLRCAEYKMSKAPAFVLRSEGTAGSRRGAQVNKLLHAARPNYFFANSIT
jgi:hypothetical protein